MKREIIANVLPEETRIAVLDNGRLAEFMIERPALGMAKLVGNIYKGRIVNLEPSIQAAFVDFGVGRNGFLHISDIEPQYYRQGGYDPDQPSKQVALCKHGNINVLTSDRGTSQLAQGNTANTALVEVERYVEIAPNVSAFDLPSAG